MKKTLWTIVMGMLFILTSCQSEEDFAPTPQTTKANFPRFYGVKTVDDQPETRGVAQKQKLWYNGTTVSVKFLNDPHGMAQKVKTYAAEWEQYANITFNFVDVAENADVRIGFDSDTKWVTWSYTGTDCKFIKDQNEPTVNFSFFDMKPEEELKGDILRAFGQVLGLEMEHRHIDYNPGWTSQISKYWQGEIEDIPWAELKQYVFDPLSTINLVQTQEFDAQSIMIWPFSYKYATNTARDYNYALSAQDKEFINTLYPKEVEQLAFAMKPSSQPDSGWGYAVEIDLYRKGTFRIEFADGTSVTREGDDKKPVILAVKQELMKIYGDPTNVKSIRQVKKIAKDYLLYCWEISDISLCKELVRLESDLGNAEFYDFSNNPKLEFLGISGLYLKGIGISMLDNLKFLHVYGGKMSFQTPYSLEISNPNIEKLTVQMYAISNLDVNKLSKLKEIKVASFMLESLNLSDNKLLESLTVHASVKDLNISNITSLKSINLYYVEDNINLSNYTNLSFIYLFSVGFLKDATSATQFANNLPITTEYCYLEIAPSGTDSEIRELVWNIWKQKISKYF